MNLPILTVMAMSWALFYIVVCAVLKFLVCDETLEGYPRWAYFASVLHQGIVLPLIALPLLWQPITFEQWMAQPWNSELLVEQMVHCSIIGAMIKDYWLYGDSIDWFFSIHHLLTVCGCSLCLVVPKGVGIVTLNALNAEICSVFYNCKVLFPCALTSVNLFVFMGISNLAALYIAHQFITLPIAMHWTIPYGTLCILIFLIRCGGWVQTVQVLSTRQTRSSTVKKAV
jgi:hypothetical protein